MLCATFLFISRLFFKCSLRANYYTGSISRQRPTTNGGWLFIGRQRKHILLSFSARSSCYIQYIFFFFFFLHHQVAVSSPSLVVRIDPPTCNQKIFPWKPLCVGAVAIMSSGIFTKTLILSPFFAPIIIIIIIIAVFTENFSRCKWSTSILPTESVIQQAVGTLAQRSVTFTTRLHHK